MVFRTLTSCAVFKKSELDVISGHEINFWGPDVSQLPVGGFVS